MYTVERFEKEIKFYKKQIAKYEKKNDQKMVAMYKARIVRNLDRIADWYR